MYVQELIIDGFKVRSPPPNEERDSTGNHFPVGQIRRGPRRRAGGNSFRVASRMFADDALSLVRCGDLKLVACCAVICQAHGRRRLRPHVQCHYRPERLRQVQHPRFHLFRSRHLATRAGIAPSCTPPDFSPQPGHNQNLNLELLPQVRAGSLQELVYKQGQAGVTRASVTIVFNNKDKKGSPVGYESYDEITVCRQVTNGAPLPSTPTSLPPPPSRRLWTWTVQNPDVAHRGQRRMQRSCSHRRRWGWSSGGSTVETQRDRQLDPPVWGALMAVSVDRKRRCSQLAGELCELPCKQRRDAERGAGGCGAGCNRRTQQVPYQRARRAAEQV